MPFPPPGDLSDPGIEPTSLTPSALAGLQHYEEEKLNEPPSMSPPPPPPPPYTCLPTGMDNFKRAKISFCSTAASPALRTVTGT